MAYYNNNINNNQINLDLNKKITNEKLHNSININYEDHDKNKCAYKSLKNLNLNEILKYYYDEKEGDNKDNLADIYFYKVHFKNSGNKEGKYSANFKAKYGKLKNYKNVKNLFRKRIKHYYISENKELKKFVDVKDATNNETVTKSLLVVSIKNREKLLNYYHYITEHKNYHILHDKIINEGYYWNNLNKSCRSYIKNCKICLSKNKNNFIPPPCNQILCDKTKRTLCNGYNRYST